MLSLRAAKAALRAKALSERQAGGTDAPAVSKSGSLSWPSSARPAPSPLAQQAKWAALSLDGFRPPKRPSFTGMATGSGVVPKISGFEACPLPSVRVPLARVPHNRSAAGAAQSSALSTAQQVQSIFRSKAGFATAVVEWSHSFEVAHQVPLRRNGHLR